VLGGLIGAAAGGGDGRSVGAGVIAGAATGGVMCAVIAALDEQDKAQVRAAQLAAARSGQSQYIDYRGSDGLERKIRVQVTAGTPGAAQMPKRGERKRTGAPPSSLPADKSEAQIAAASGERVCRGVTASVEVQGKGQANLPQQAVCRTPDGDWVPAPGDSIAQSSPSSPS